MREAFFFCVLAALLLAVSFPAYSVIVFSDEDYAKLLTGQKQQNELAENRLKQLESFQERYRQVIQDLNLALENYRKAMEYSKKLSILNDTLLTSIDGLQQSLKAARFWNDAWPWIAVGVGVICVAGGLWLGHSLK